MDWKTLLFSARGRINRSRYWLTILAIEAVFMVLYLPIALSVDKNSGPNAIQSVLLVFIGIFGLVVGYCGLVLAIKRWHDRDKSGWWVLISFVPLIGTIWYIVEVGFLRGTIGSNRFGPDPLSPHDDIVQVFGAPERQVIR